MVLVIDATNKIAGRLASIVAKLLLIGEEVIILNAEKAVISGKKDRIFRIFKEKRDKGDPYKGPFYPRYPDRILRRMIRGMLPYKKPKGKNALKRLKIFIGTPEEYKNAKVSNIKIKSVEDLKTDYVTLEEISLFLGAKKRW